MVREKKGKGKHSRTAVKLPSKEIPQEAPPDEEQSRPSQESSPKVTQEAEGEAFDLSQSLSQDTQCTQPPHKSEKKEGPKLPPIEFPDYVLDKFFNFMEKSKILWSNDKEYPFNKKQRKEEAWKELQAFLIRTFPQHDPDMFTCE